MNDTLYQFEIPNTKRKMYQLFAYGIFVINAVASLLFSYFRDSSKGFYLLLAAIVCIGIMLWVTLKNADYKIKKSASIFMFVFGIIIWLKYSMYWGSVINIALLFLHLNAVKQLMIQVTKEYISYPSFIEKKISWNEIQNIILKDGLLTIDQKDNKLIQYEVLYDEVQITEENFNQFCSKLKS